MRTAHKTAVEAFQENDKQLSFLSKNCGDAPVQLLISILLRETFGLTLTPVNKAQLVQMAGEIQSSFWMLRFDEIVFALKAGINGEYGVVMGHINYQHIGSWLNGYCATRGKMIEGLRSKHHIEATSKYSAIQALSAIPPEEIENIGKANEDYTEKTKVPELTKEEIRKKLDDGARLVQFDRFKKHLPVERMQAWRDEAQRNDWKRTMQAIDEQLKTVTSWTVRLLAKKIAAGTTTFTPSELQTQLNFPKEIELELKRLADEKQKNPTSQNTGTAEANKKA